MYAIFPLTCQALCENIFWQEEKSPGGQPGREGYFVVRRKVTKGQDSGSKTPDRKQGIAEGTIAGPGVWKSFCDEFELPVSMGMVTAYRVSLFVADSKRINRKINMNQQPELNFCPDCEAKLEYDPGELTCPNCGWKADEAYLQQYEHSHDY